MSILEKLKRISPKDQEISDFCIQTIRFKKFLENARTLLALFDDGREKARGEYIFDRHYVVTLIDSVVENLGMMVYDACVLVPESGKLLYAAFDAKKITAKNLIGPRGSARTAGRAGDGTVESSNPEDPEFLLLAEALQWFNGNAAPLNSTVMDFMKDIFFKVIHGLESIGIMKNRNLFKNCKSTDMGIFLIDLWKELNVDEEKRSINDCNCIPLRYLLMDADTKESKACAKEIHNNPDWVAAVSEYKLSLNKLRPDFQFRLETMASGDPQSDFIFIFTDNLAILDKLLPEGFHIETADYGQFAWNIDVSDRTIEESLMKIGQNLFN